MIQAFSHFCFVTNNIERETSLLRSFGYRSSFQNIQVGNPNVKKPLSQFYSKNHRISLFEHHAKAAVELISYQDNTQELGIEARLSELITTQSLPIPILLEGPELTRFVDENFSPTLTPTVYRYKSRFSKVSVKLDFQKRDAFSKHIDTPGTIYPAFWVRSLSETNKYFPDGKISNKFKLEIQGRLIQGCLAIIRPGVYFEFLQISSQGGTE